MVWWILWIALDPANEKKMRKLCRLFQRAKKIVKRFHTNSIEKFKIENLFFFLSFLGFSFAGKVSNFFGPLPKPRGIDRNSWWFSEFLFEFCLCRGLDPLIQFVKFPQYRNFPQLPNLFNFLFSSKKKNTELIALKSTLEHSTRILRRTGNPKKPINEI